MIEHPPELGVNMGDGGYNTIYDNTGGTRVIPSWYAGLDPSHSTSTSAAPGTGLGYGQPGANGNNNINLGNVNLPFFQQDREDLTKQMAGKSPYASQDWNGLISQLQARASGDPSQSLAMQNYNIANNNAVNQIGSLARGTNSAGAAQTAMQQAARLGQGQASGLALATTQEEQANQGALTQALGSRDQLNQSAYNAQMMQKLGLSGEQLKALQGDQSFWQGKTQLNNQSNANTWGSIASMAGLAAMLLV